MIEMLKDFHPIAIKEYLCELCGGKINKGQKYHRQTNVCDGYVCDWIEHDECCQVVSELDMYSKCDLDEGLSSDAFKDKLDEYIRQTHYNDLTDDVDEDWKGLTRHEQVCKILDELKK